MSCVDETRERQNVETERAAQSHLPSFVLKVFIPFRIADNVRYLSRSKRKEAKASTERRRPARRTAGPPAAGGAAAGRGQHPEHRPQPVNNVQYERMENIRY